MFISAKVIAFMVKAEKAKSETQYNTSEQYTPKLRDLTYNLDTYKKNPTDSSLTTLIQTLECFDHTLKKCNF